MGVVKSMKSYFRHEMHEQLVDILDDAPEAALMAQTAVKQINFLDAMHMIKGAWAKITTSTIQSCWKNGGVTNDELKNVIISLAPSPVGQREKEFRNWVSINDDADLTVK